MATITIEGNVATDVDMRVLPSGQEVASFMVISSKNKKLDDGSWESTEVTPWSIKVWGNGAENVAESVKKGTALVIHGSVSEESWEDKETGAKRSKMVVNAYSLGVNLKRHKVTVLGKSDDGARAVTASADGWGAPAPVQNAWG